MGDRDAAVARRGWWLLIAVTVAVVVLLLVVLSLVVLSDCKLGSWACPLYVPPDAEDDDVLVFGCVDTHVPGPPCCTHWLRASACCVLYVPEAQGSLRMRATAVRTTYAHQHHLGRAVPCALP